MNERWLEDRDDDISKLFRDNEEQLEETPSFRTWDRVERKLERRRGQKRKVMYRYTSMIAASIGVLAMIYIIGFLDTLSGFEDSSMAQKTEMTNNNQTEQHTSNKEVAVLEEEAEYKPIDENNFSELEEKTFEELKINEEPIASNFQNQPSKKNINIPNSPKVAKSRANQTADMVRLDTKPSTKIQTPDAEVNADWTFPVNKIEEEVEEEEMAYDDKAESLEPVVEATTLNHQGNPIPNNKDEKVSVRKTKAADKREYAQKESLADKPQKTYSINQFNWLSGDWRDVSIGGSYENWQVGKSGLNGSGYVIIGSDTSFVEAMRIYQRGKDIFFEGPVDATQKTRKFKLDSYAGNEAIFNRKGKNFPNQVIITRHTNNSYSIVYQNKDAIEVDTKEQLYFKYRNRLNSQRAARNMTRY